MRLLSFMFLCIPILCAAQQEDRIAPEGKILNYRTLTWSDFQGKEDKESAQKLAEQHLQAKAYVCPAIYFTADSCKINDQHKVSCRFHVKCAFQSRAFVRESTLEEHSDYVLIHEQDHYDIALTYANLLQTALSTHDYDEDKYEDEINKIAHELQDKYHKTQETYDHEVNPEGKDDTAKQSLWDMRIKKGLENGTDEYFNSPLATVQTVRWLGQTVKRLPGEPDLQFAVRVRPLYSEMTQELAGKIKSSEEWTNIPAVIAFYNQRYYSVEEGMKPELKYRTLAYMFIPNGKGAYKRTIIDTFANDGLPVKISGVFYANADSDQAKELVIMATSSQKDKHGSGTLYINRVYDDIGKLVPGRLKRLNNISGQIEGGFEGQREGRSSKAQHKTEKEVADELKKHWP